MPASWTKRRGRTRLPSSVPLVNAPEWWSQVNAATIGGIAKTTAATAKTATTRTASAAPRRAEERETPMPQPGRRDSGQALREAERRERADRVAVGEARVQRRLVGRGREAGEVAAVGLDPVEHREVRRGFVELDVAVQGRAAREHRRRGVGEVGAEPGGRSPGVGGERAAGGERE